MGSGVNTLIEFSLRLCIVQPNNETTIFQHAQFLPLKAFLNCYKLPLICFLKKNYFQILFLFRFSMTLYWKSVLNEHSLGFTTIRKWRSIYMCVNVFFRMTSGLNIVKISVINVIDVYIKWHICLQINILSCLLTAKKVLIAKLNMLQISVVNNQSKCLFFKVCAATVNCFGMQKNSFTCF